MAGDESQIAVEEASLLIAAHFRENLQVDDWLAVLDQLAVGCSDSSLESIRSHLFVHSGFSGNSCAYYDPNNSCLDVVIAERTGIPITLSVLVLAVGRRVGREFVGIAFPSHFLLRDTESGVYFDAFNGGVLLDHDGCVALHQQIHGPDIPFDERWLTPVGPRSIIRRMLNNLVAISIATRDHDAHVMAARLRVLLPDSSLSERADLAGALAAKGEFSEAATIIDALANNAPPDEAVGFHNAALLLRSRLN